MAAIAIGSAASSPAADVAPSPVLPDKWDWVAPLPAGAKFEEVNASLLDDGDVLIWYTYQDRVGKEKTHFTTMFREQSVDSARSQLGKGLLVMSDGTRRQVVADSSPRAILRSGQSLRTISRVYRDCYRGPAREVLAREGVNGEVDLQKALVVMLDRPRRFVGGGGSSWFHEKGGSCPDEPPLKLSYRLETVQGLFLALPDGTALLTVGNHPFILRLDSNLESRSSLLQRDLFLFTVDWDDSELLIDKINHKNYRLSEDGSWDYQKALDDLYAYLLSIRKEK